MKSIVVLGRQPEIGIAELESIYSEPKIRPVGDFAAAVDYKYSEINFKRLGGAVKLAELLAIIEDGSILSDLKSIICEIDLPDKGKLTIGISAYGIKLSVGKINAMALELKKLLRSKSHGVRVVPNKKAFLNSAQVLHNKLASENGIELLLLADGDKIIVARTRNVQNINEYTERDRGRPKRDAYVGMLPPKLAQIIINLASSKTQTTNLRLLDPFCGTGVILQEALLMGYNVYGTDIEPRMVEYSKTNIDWLENYADNKDLEVDIEQADACKFTWQQPIDLVAGESFLGQPLKTLPKDEELAKMIHNINFLHKKFFKNLANQIPADTKMCLAIPAWYKNGGFIHLPLLDQLTELGYNRVAFEHTGDKGLIYHRPDQIVARELVTLIRK